MMENFIPLTSMGQQRILADMAAFHAMRLKRDGASALKISELELAQPPAMRMYFRCRLKYWQKLYSVVFSL
ncbi:hypothetical protein [Sodalis sp. RH22]|uniref:hypothetical protein n=1 Tax=unclassified Sodalis (in: enterobacteria) TaxID=2636512 RepID=UPI0039B5B3FE